MVENINVTKSIVIFGNGSALKSKTAGAPIFTSIVAKTVAFRDLVIRNTKSRDVASESVSLVNLGMLNSISVANPKNSGSSAIDIANYAGQGTANKFI
ncbi:hypothetical protein E0M25_02725 [Bacillus mycoides]|uniref:hypothetical protein n=1 Tax=Bacillus mycoides TaxID=1405 RepID=UPI00103BC936|nr:hypothetical protein [Bacillus mycoides]TBX82493.1 hypothetical protein E0M25_02725 [Bacillus mycoides]